MYVYVFVNFCTFSLFSVSYLWSLDVVKFLIGQSLLDNPCDWSVIPYYINPFSRRLLSPTSFFVWTWGLFGISVVPFLLYFLLIFKSWLNAVTKLTTRQFWAYGVHF